MIPTSGLPVSVQGAANIIQGVVNQAQVKPLGNPYTIGISGMIFDIVEVIDMVIDSESTDNVVENNITVQDHVVQKPIIITVKGKAGEVVSVFNPSPLSAIFAAVQGLVPLVGLSPSINAQDAQFYNTLNETAQLAQNVVGAVSSVFQLFGQSVTAVTRQQSVFGFLINLRNTNTLCDVETPWAVFHNMMINSIKPSQSEETVFISDFIVTFKQILTVNDIQGTVNVNSTDSQNTGTLTSNPTIGSGSFNDLVSNPVNLGNDNGTQQDSNGNQFTVASVSQNIYTQQAQSNSSLIGLPI